MANPLCEVRFRAGDVPGARYVLGRLVYDELFTGGRLLTRYWSPDGQVWPEMHYSSLRWKPDHPADVFRLSVNGLDLAGGYVWESASLEPFAGRGERPDYSQDTIQAVIQLRHAEAGIVVRVHTRLDGGPFLVRWLEITNLKTYAVGITEVAPFAGMLWSHRTDEHLPSGIVSPFELAYTHLFDWGREGDFWFEPVAAGRKAVNGGRKGRSGWGRPAFWARNRCNGQTFVCELAWGGNYEFALDFRAQEDGNPSYFSETTRTGELFFRMGLSGYDQVLRVLAPGETVTTPAVHVGLFHTDTDVIVQATHDHVRHGVLPDPVPGRSVEIEANHRGYLCDRENVPDMLRDIDVAQAVGAEMYVVDAGWYGNEPNHWGENAGDWFDGPWMTEGGGLKAVADHAHSCGLKFGLWVEIEAAGSSSALRRDHPDWLLKRDGVPIANGRALDLTQSAVAEWAESEIERLIRTYDLDMYRIDHNHLLQPSGNREYEGLVEDVMWRYYDALYGIIDRVRARFPDVVFQNCAGGGGRLDWGTLSHFHDTELSDWMRLPRGLRILNGVTMSLPPEILLRTFGTEVHEHVLDGNLDTQLRLCLCRVIFRGIAPSLDELTPYLADRITHYVDLYKSVIRPTMIEGLVYHHTPFLSVSPTGPGPQLPWCVLEYARPDRSVAVACVFRVAADGDDGEYAFRARGLDASRRYRVTWDSAQQTCEVDGLALMQQGITVRLDSVLTSELLTFEAVR